MRKQSITQAPDPFRGRVFFRAVTIPKPIAKLCRTPKLS